jgi:hypothetical protein
MTVTSTSAASNHESPEIFSRKTGLALAALLPLGLLLRETLLPPPWDLHVCSGRLPTYVHDIMRFRGWRSERWWQRDTGADIFSDRDGHASRDRPHPIFGHGERHRHPIALPGAACWK